MSMDLTPPEEMRQILDAAQSMLDSHYPVSRLREGASADDPAPLAEFGTFILALPEEQAFAAVRDALSQVAPMNQLEDQVVAAFEYDFLSLDGDALKNARNWARSRRSGGSRT